MRSNAIGIRNIPEIDNLTPDDCFRLFYRLGSLEFNDWKLLSDVELPTVETSFSDLEGRLRRLLTSKRREQLLGCPESGVLREARRDPTRLRANP